MKFIQFLMVCIIGVAMSCTPFVEDKIELGDLPNPSFEISQGSDANEYILENTTPDAFITKWDLGQYGAKEGNEVVVDIPFQGVYPITMTTFNDGGSASIDGEIVVNEDDPNACFGNIEILTNCDTKVWVLAPEASALHVGPNLEETWWGNSESDVSARTCHFNDEYIFSSDGSFKFDSKGDLWADSDGNGDIFPPELGLSVGCHDETAFPGDFAAWGSGDHAFTIDESSLTVAGFGAWMGLYKAGTASEVGTPQESVSLNILELTSERMVLYADYGGVVWRFTFVSI